MIPWQKLLRIEIIFLPLGIRGVERGLIALLLHTFFMGAELTGNMLPRLISIREDRPRDHFGP